MSFDSLKSIRDWNIKCANRPAEPYSDAYWLSLKNQAERLQEEVTELVEAIKARDRLETVDAQADIQVVLAGLIFLSQHDHDGAMLEVCKNNDQKYFTSRSECEHAAWLIEKESGVSVNVQPSEFEGKTYWSIHRESDNKIMKPIGHPKVDLSPYVFGFEDYSIMVVTKPNCALCDALLINLDKTLGIKDVEILEPYTSQADFEFCVTNGLTVGDLVFYNGTELRKTNYGSQAFDIRRVGSWLKQVGAV